MKFSNEQPLLMSNNISQTAISHSLVTVRRIRRSHSRTLFNLIIFNLVMITCTGLFSVGALSQQAAQQACPPEYVQQLNQTIDAQESILQQFANLRQGELSEDFTLSSIFAINITHLTPTDNYPNQTLSTSLLEPGFANCSPYNVERLKQRLQDVEETKERYTALSLEKRRYLETLVDIFHQLTTTQVNLTHEIEALEKALDQLNQRQSELIAAHHSEQEPTVRTELSQQSSQSSQQIDVLNNELVSKHQALDRTTALLNFNRALLQDFHLVYIYNPFAYPSDHDVEANRSSTDSSEATQNKQPTYSLKSLTQFIELTNHIHIKALLKPSLQSSVSISDSAHLLNSAILYILYSRISHDAKLSIPLTEQIDSLQDLVILFKNELLTLTTLPAANLHLKMVNGSSKYEFLSRNVMQSAKVQIIQLLIAFLLWQLLYRAPKWLNKLQRLLIKGHLSKPTLRPIIRLLRVVQLNLAWLIAVAVFLTLESLDSETLREWILLYDLCAIMAFYLIVSSFTSWSINNTYRQKHLFITKAKQQIVDHKRERFSQYVTLLAIFYIIINNIVPEGLISLLYMLLLLNAIWHLLYRLIEEFYPEFQSHLSKRVSNKVIHSYHSDQHPIFKHLLVPPTFLALQLIDLLYDAHHLLLRIESYQMLSARFIKMRLEKSSTASTQQQKGAQEGDLHYETWFVNREMAAKRVELLIPAPSSDQVTQQVNRWLNESQDENDLAIIGECGCGKSTMMRQWHKAWKETPSFHITIPEKTVTEEALFDLIKEALELSIDNDIAQFVNAQKSLPKTVITIDEAQNLFLSDVGGFKAYKTLQNLISSRVANIFWIVIINQQSWIYLNDLFSGTYQFSNTITINRWTQQEIRDLIMTRHRESWRGLRYDDLLLASSSHIETATQAAESRCFSMLWEQSNGIAAVALSIWAHAARTPEPGMIEIGITERPTSPALQKLSDEHLFIYAALIKHETLNTQQTQAVTHLPEAVVRRTFKFGLDQGFLVRLSKGLVTINSLWYIQLSQLLRRKNFIHE